MKTNITLQEEFLQHQIEVIITEADTERLDWIPDAVKQEIIFQLSDTPEGEFSVEQTGYYGGTWSIVKKIKDSTGSLVFKEEESDLLEFYLDPEKTPDTYNRKLFELIKSGMNKWQAEKFISDTPIIMELAYDIDRGLFMVECEAINSCDIYNPYTGMIIPNDNHPYTEPDPIKFLDTFICQLADMPVDLRNEVYNKHDFSLDHMACLESAIESLDEAHDILQDIDLTEEREKYNLQKSENDNEYD